MTTPPTRRQIDEMTRVQSEAKARTMNYDPTDPDKMRLPSGVTCGDCAHIRRCTLMFGHTATDTYCDWSPSRFRQPAPSAGTCITPSPQGAEDA